MLITSALSHTTETFGVRYNGCIKRVTNKESYLDSVISIIKEKVLYYPRISNSCPGIHIKTYIKCRVQPNSTTLIISNQPIWLPYSTIQYRIKNTHIM